MKKLCTLLALLIAAPVAFLGCSDVNTDGLDNKAGPTFTYFGVVTDTAANRLAGVEVCFWFDGKDTCVKTAGDDAKTAKNEAGMYSVDGVPFDSDVKVTANYTIPAVADDPKTEDVDESKAAVPFFPVEMTFSTPGDEVIGGGDEVTYQDNIQWEMNLTMVAASYTATGYVYANGAPAAGATVVLDLRDEGFPVYETATVDADGMFSFAGLPASTLEWDIHYDLFVMPYDKDGDGQPDFDGLWRSFDPFWAGPDQWVFNLMGSDGYMYVVYSNVEDGSHASADPIVVVFNQVINSADIFLEDVTRYNFNIAFTYEIVAGIKLVITPVGPLSGSSEFYLEVEGYNSANGNSAYDYWWFNTGGATDVEPIMGLALQNPADKFDLDDNCFDVKWTTDPNAEEYCVYAMNNGAATDWNRVDCFSGGGSASPQDAVQFHTVCVPDYYDRKFDSINGDAWWTGLEGGTQITFVVTGINFEGYESPIAGADTLTVADTVVPDYYGPWKNYNDDYDFVNSDPTADETVNVCLSFSEYMDRSVEPTATLAFATVTDPVTPPVASIAGWTWDNDAQGGCFQVVVPKAATSTDDPPVVTPTNASADEITIDLAGVKDTSGNAITDLDSATAGNQTTVGPTALGSLPGTWWYPN